MTHTWHDMLRTARSYKTVAKFHPCVFEWIDRNSWLIGAMHGPPSPYRCDHYEWDHNELDAEE